MKKITLLMGVVLASLVGAAQTISTFPYNEDFEGMTNGTTFNGGWANINAGTFWTVDVNGTTSGSTGPSGPGGTTTNAPDHNPGIVGGKYIYVETSGGVGNNTNIARAQSPFFNLTSFTDAKLDFWYHAFGNGIGSLNVEARVGTQGTWANIAGPITDNVNLWQNNNLCVGPVYAGNDSVQFRFSYQVGNGFGGDLALDDISVLGVNPIDIGVTALLVPSGCGVTTTETFDVTICNFGDALAPGVSIPVTFVVQGGTPVVENIILPAGLASTCNNGCVTVTTTTTFNLTAGGNLTISATTGLAGDAVAANDDFSVVTQVAAANDVGVTAIVGPSGCGLTTTETVDVTICNFGDSLLPGALIPVSLSVNGAAAVVNNFILVNGLGSSCNNGCVTLTTNITFDFSVGGTYTIVGTSGLAGDIALLNNIGSGTVNSLIPEGALPYFQDFESGQGTWVISNGGTGSFDFGTPAANVITGTASGVNAFATNLAGNYNNNEASSVTSSCIDITTATGNEVVTMKVFWHSENSWDGANLFASYDVGATWVQVGNNNDPNNWYNDNTIGGAPQGSQEGWTGDNFNGSAGWVVAQHRLDSALMVDNTTLLLRVGFGSDGSINTRNGIAFDDIAVGLPTHTYEYGVAGIDSVMGVCSNMFVLDAGAGHSFYHYSDLNNNFTGTWTNDPTLTVTSTGTYVITVTNAMGMMATDTVFIEFLDFQPPVLVDVIDCTPGAIALFDAGSGTIPGNITYSWGTGGLGQIDTLFATGTIWVTKTDATLGCSASDTAIFIDEPIFTLGNDTSFCAGDTLILNPGPALSYLWNDATSNPTLAATTAGDYYVTITDGNGCPGSDTLTVLAVNPLPIVDLGSDTLFCIGTIGSLDAGAGGTYLWNDGSTTQTLAPTVSDVYSVIVTDANGCVGTDTTIIVINTCVGVDELTSDTEIKMYPNPTQGGLTIEFAAFNNDVVMNVLNIYGQVVRTGKLTSATTVLDLNDLSEGTYILQLQSEDSITVNKFVINR